MVILTKMLGRGVPQESKNEIHRDLNMSEKLNRDITINLAKVGSKDSHLEKRRYNRSGQVQKEGSIPTYHNRFSFSYLYSHQVVLDLQKEEVQNNPKAERFYRKP